MLAVSILHFSRVRIGFVTSGMDPSFFVDVEASVVLSSLSLSLSSPCSEFLQTPTTREMDIKCGTTQALQRMYLRDCIRNRTDTMKILVAI